MRKPLLFAAILLAPVLAHAQPKPTAVPPAATPDASGTEPMSTKASNILPGDTHTVYAPRLPDPDVGPDATPRGLLSAAKADLAANKTGAAQEALERAETRLLARTLSPDMADKPDSNPMVAQIAQARQMLGGGDTAGAARLIDKLLAAS